MLWVAFLAASVSCAAYFIEAVVLIWLHIKAPQYNPVNHAISDYGVGQTKSLFIFYLQLNNIGTFTFAVALIAGFGTPLIPLRTLIFLFLLILCRIAIVFFPTDLEGSPLTRTGFLHYVFAVLVFALLYTTIAELTRIFGANILIVLSVIATYSLTAVVVTMWKPLRKAFGFFERIFIGATILWFLAASVFLIIFFH
jgi:hypothetical protein